MEELFKWIEITTGFNSETQTELMYSVVIILTLWLLRNLILRLVWQRSEDARIRYSWQKSTNYVAVALGFLMVGSMWFKGFQSTATFLGLISAGIAIALKDVVANLAGWIFIVWRKPFTVGDRIQIASHAGDVIDVRPFQFTLLEIGNWVESDQSTGRIIHIPNGMVITEVLANYSKGFQFIWNEIPVLITFESDWQKAKKILIDIAQHHAASLSKTAEERIKEASKKFMIFYQTLTPTVYTSVKDCGVELTVRYLCEPRQRRGTEQAIWEDVLKAFAQSEEIDFAYPTQRFYHNLMEGKPGTKPQEVIREK